MNLPKINCARLTSELSLNKITKILEKGEEVNFVSLDFSRVFHVVSPSISCGAGLKKLWALVAKLATRDKNGWC